CSTRVVIFQVNDETVAHIARGSPHLQYLCLSNCTQITDRSLISLSQGCRMLTAFPTVVNYGRSPFIALHHNKGEIGRYAVLELDNCPQITDSALSHMRHAKALKRIDLYDCQNVSKEAIQRFKHHRPHVEIHAYFAPATPPANPATARAGISVFRVLFPISCWFQ
ncbi:hypothetical protein COOONC_21272, partial [Cooperia oncophora]